MRRKPWEMFGVMPAGDTQYRGPAIGDLQGINLGQQEINIPQNYSTQQQIPQQVYQPPFKYEGLDPLFGVLETVDYLTAAPLRAGLYEAVKGLKRGEYGPWNFFKGAVNSYKKPMGSPRGKDIAKEMGISDKPLNESSGRLSFGGVASKASPAGVAGFVGENVLDPTNYVGAGMLAGGLKKADDVPYKNIMDNPNFKNWFGDSKVLDDYDFESPITHESYEKDFSGIKKGSEVGYGSVFDGVFGLKGLEGAGLSPGKSHNTFIPRKGRVARKGDTDLDYDKAIETIKNEYPDATESQIEYLYKFSAKDKEITDYFDVADSEHPLKDIISEELSTASWEMQNLRGKIAKDQDYDAIAVNDENGTSYFIPYGTKAIFVAKRDPFKTFDDDEFKEYIKQIKSATGNRGTFDPKDPNILKAIPSLGALGLGYQTLQNNNRRKDAP